MKKILIIQHKSSTFGGVWSVNITLAQEFMRKGYDVTIASIREKFDKTFIPAGIKIYTVDKKHKWEVPQKKEIIEDLKRIRINKALKKFVEIFKRQNDIKKLKKFIKDSKPDYIISSHYQMLDGIPNNYLKRTIHVHHSAFSFATSNKNTMKKLYKYNGKVIYCWLSKGTLKCAKKAGLKNNIYIYNPVRFNCEVKADVVKNKKLIVMTRLSEEKRIDLMVRIVEDVFNDKCFKDWTFEIYGEGSEQNLIKNTIKNPKQIKLMGRSNDAISCYLSSSINLSTSRFEGFSMSVLEAQECGIPTITFNFGESAKEQIINGKTGYIIKMNDVNKYKKELINLLKSKKLLKQLSENCKQNSQTFHVKNIILSWEKIFRLIDKEV